MQLWENSNTAWFLFEIFSSSLFLNQGEWEKKPLQVWSSSEEIVSQFRTAQEGPLFKSKMEIKGWGYVQEIIKAFFFFKQYLILLKHNAHITKNPKEHHT